MMKNICCSISYQHIRPNEGLVHRDGYHPYHYHYGQLGYSVWIIQIYHSRIEPMGDLTDGSLVSVYGVDS